MGTRTEAPYLLKVIARQHKMVARQEGEAAALRDELRRSVAAREMYHERSRELLDNLLKVEFETRVVKGCYPSCPVGRIGKPTA